MRGIIDRFEGNFAIIELEEKIMKNISKSDLPAGVKEGDAVFLANGRWHIDKAWTETLNTGVKKAADDLFT